MSALRNCVIDETTSNLVRSPARNWSMSLSTSTTYERTLVAPDSLGAVKVGEELCSTAPLVEPDATFANSETDCVFARSRRPP